MPTQPEFLYATLVLPSLFALTLISEGVAKIMKHESGLIPMMGGFLFLSIIIGVYVGFLRR